MPKDTTFYKVVRPLVVFLVKILFHPKVKGIENIPKDKRFLLAGNHTKFLDPVIIVGVQKRHIHFLAKEELFHGITKFIVKGMGCVPVNRKIHDHNALQGAIDYLNNDLCVGIFPEGTINKTNKTVLPFKIGAVKACHDTNTLLVPFVITGRYKIIGKGVQIEFLKPIKIGNDLTKENDKFMKLVSDKIKENKNER